MEFILRIFVNWGIIGGLSVLVTGLIGKLIAAKTQRVSCAGVMSILNGILAAGIALPSANKERRMKTIFLTVFIHNKYLLSVDGMHC